MKNEEQFPTTPVNWLAVFDASVVMIAVTMFSTIFGMGLYRFFH